MVEEDDAKSCGSAPDPQTGMEQKLGKNVFFSNWKTGKLNKSNTDQQQVSSQKLPPR